MGEERWTLKQIEREVREFRGSVRSHIVHGPRYLALLLTARDALTRAQPACVLHGDEYATPLRTRPCSACPPLPSGDQCAVRAGCPEDWRERAMLAVHAGYMAGVNPDDNWARVEAEARRILDAEQPAPTCETCGGSGGVLDANSSPCDGCLPNGCIYSDCRHMKPCPDCRPECETCGGTCARCQGSRLTQTGDQCLPCMEGKPVPCPDCAGEAADDSTEFL